MKSFNNHWKPRRDTLPIVISEGGNQDNWKPCYYNLGYKKGHSSKKGWTEGVWAYLVICLYTQTKLCYMKLGPKSPTGFSSNINPDDPWAQTRNGMGQEFNWRPDQKKGKIVNAEKRCRRKIPRCSWLLELFEVYSAGCVIESQATFWFLAHFSSFITD